MNTAIIGGIVAVNIGAFVLPVLALIGALAFVVGCIGAAHRRNES